MLIPVITKQLTPIYKIKALQLVWSAFFACLGLGLLGCTEQAKRPLTTLELGEKVYFRRCFTCHQANGKGMAGNRRLAADLTTQRGVMDQSDMALAQTIKTGLTGPIGKMPPLGPVLSDEEIAAVLVFVRHKFQGEDFTPQP